MRAVWGVLQRREPGFLLPADRRSQPDERRGELDHGQVVARTLVVAGGDPAELLEPIHAPLDPVALGVGRPVEPRPATLSDLVGITAPIPRRRNSAHTLGYE